MSNPRREKQRMVKKKISQILLSVREEKQHIENQLARNDLRIKQYCEEYQKLRHQTDLTNFSQNQTIILLNIIDGLKYAHIDPLQILGEQVSDLITYDDSQEQGEICANRLNTDEVIKLQQSIIHDLLNQIQEVERNEELNKKN